jgi:hypothetical protein
MNKTLVSINYYNIVALFLPMVEKCSYTLKFCIFFGFLISFGMKDFSIGSLLPSSFETLSKFAWDFRLPTTF